MNGSPLEKILTSPHFSIFMEPDALILGKNRPMASISMVAILLMTVFSLGLMFSVKDYQVSERVISWDVASYYNYLPAAFKYHSFDFNTLPLRAGYVISPNGLVSEKMTMGVAFLYLPFYLLAWLYILIAGVPNFEYGPEYSLMMNLSAIVYFLAGMLFLRKVLLHYFSDLVTALGLIGIFFGTNLLYYTAYYGPMSHVYSFFLISCFLWILIKWHRKPGWGSSLLLGFIAGWIVLVRPSNVTIFLLALFWDVSDINSIKAKWNLVKTHWPKLFLLALGALLIWIPQMIYWKAYTGEFIYFSYQGEGFFFRNPKMLQGLFSYRNGWLLYAPIMVCSIAGFVFLRKTRRNFLLPVVLYFLVSIYIIFSWWCWWYVGFGLRAMIDLYPVLVIPFCVLLERVFKMRKGARIPVLTLWGLLLMFGLLKNYQFKKGILHFDSMSGKNYWAAFYSLEVPSADYYTHLKTPDYDAAMRGESKLLNPGP